MGFALTEDHFQGLFAKKVTITFEVIWLNHF